MKGKKILLVIPAYNEEESILDTYNTVMEYNKKNKTKYDVIVINDGSKDNTEKILRENDIPHVRLILNLGIGGAVQTGYKYALQKGYDIAVQFDGDGQHDISCVKDIVKPIVDGKCDMVIGSRFIDKNNNTFKSSKLRRLGIKVISSVIKLKTKKRIYDTTSGFRAVDKDVLRVFTKTYPQEFPEPISTVYALLNKRKVLEVPVKMRKRMAGKSSISRIKSAYYMINVTLSILTMKGMK